MGLHLNQLAFKVKFAQQRQCCYYKYGDKI